MCTNTPMGWLKCQHKTYRELKVQPQQKHSDRENIKKYILRYTCQKRPSFDSDLVATPSGCISLFIHIPFDLPVQLTVTAWRPEGRITTGLDRPSCQSRLLSIHRWFLCIRFKTLQNRYIHVNFFNLRVMQWVVL